jgi:hypothetical protein
MEKGTVRCVSFNLGGWDLRLAVDFVCFSVRWDGMACQLVAPVEPSMDER